MDIDVSPHMGHRLWIDDIHQKVVGSRTAVRRRLVKAIVDACRSLEEHRLRVSPKSVVLCTRKADAIAIVRAVRIRGFRIKAAGQAAYLGVDFSCGRRSRAVRGQRDEKHKAMTENIRRFTRASKRYHQTSRLEKAGGGAGWNIRFSGTRHVRQAAH